MWRVFDGCMISGLHDTRGRMDVGCVVGRRCDPTPPVLVSAKKACVVLQMSLSQLRRICRRYNISASGDKEASVSRIRKYMLTREGQQGVPLNTWDKES